jgi:hypothetical protein
MWLPSGPNLTVTGLVADRYGAVSEGAVHGLNVSRLPVNELRPLLNSTLTRLRGAASVNGTLFYRALLVSSGTTQSSLDVELRMNIRRLAR